MTTPSLRRRVVAAGAALAAGLAGLAAAVLGAAPAQAASLTQVTSFGANPGGIGMYLYVPDNVPANAPVLVAIHYCTGTAQAFYQNTPYATLANQYGYIVVYPDASRPGQCFDVSSTPAMTHDGGSDPTSIANMVRYVQQHYSTDRSRVFVTGLSSGAMMTELLLADYPDLFAAGSAYAGVPATCFSTGGAAPGSTGQAGWNSSCSGGTLTRTAQQWGDLARAAYPGWSGTRPRVQLWHGTADTTLSYVNLGEAVKQWTNVLGVGQTPASTEQLSGGITRTRYGATGGQAPVEANSEQGVTHNIAIDAAATLRFFGLDQRPTPPVTTPPVTTPPVTTPPVTTLPVTTPPVTTPPASGAACTVTYQVNQWNTGFTANLTIANTSSQTVNGWRLTFTFPSGQTVTQAWSSTASQSGGAVTLTNAAWNATIAPGASQAIGFNASYSGTNTRPASFALNGTACAVA
ncbi:extracellular catalytic domain type 1 short-chain-length polyhydroxyalkanoate depolymerase [Cellulomonas alba]|uniref:PHB depolymerase family esterase n=1 Tax=Cellulomonas alba TaxID=3053467 RepID=A0ABT7SDG7_9CELL|nr:PHB depolymerase family esterase [Cellulomonas alba]MDM7854220.1 PHB depolymerase family esterase [Cellulomonas alba]